MLQWKKGFRLENCRMAIFGAISVYDLKNETGTAGF
jgi:hypothetical protein